MRAQVSTGKQSKNPCSACLAALSPADVTLQELALETFFLLDEFTRQALHALPS